MTEVIATRSSDDIKLEPMTQSHVVLPEEEVIGYDMFEIEGDIPTPSDEFMKVFENIELSVRGPEAEKLANALCCFSWKRYYDAMQQVTLDEHFAAWAACAIYCEMIARRAPSDTAPYPFLLSNIVRSSCVSALEFFDKLNRWVEIVGTNKRVKDHVQKIQGSLAVTAVVYKKLLPIFRRLFLFVEGKSSEKSTLNSSEDLIKIVWTMFILLKKSLPSEDLLNSYNLLLCVMETIYMEMVDLGLDNHVNPDFSDRLIDSDESYGLLDVLCKIFGGVVLDAKLFRTHWYKQNLESVLEIEKEAKILPKYKEFLSVWQDAYECTILKRGELDEFIFLPDRTDSVFDEAYDCAAVELLRRGSDNTSFADAELLLRISTQSCLERLADHKSIAALPTPLSAKSYVISADQQCPVTPLSCTLLQPARLTSLIPVRGFQLAGSELEKMCQDMVDNPLSSIAVNADNLVQRFADKLREEQCRLGKDYDQLISENIQRYQDLTKDLYYVLIQKIMILERERQINRYQDFASVFRKEEFLAAIFVCALELVLFSYKSVRAFPWSLKVFGLSPLAFYKVVEVVVRSEPNLSREMVKHLNRKEEEVLEELAWSVDSPIWDILRRRPGVVLPSEEACRITRHLSESYSPVKRRRLENGEERRQMSPGRVSTSLFFRKIYYLAYLRLHDLCERTRMEEKGRRLVWATFEHMLRNETTLLKGRHLDQNLLCIVYLVSKFLHMNRTFINIMEQYRHQPQSRSQIYREVSVDCTLFSGSPSEDGNSRDSCSNSASSQGLPLLRSVSTVPAPGIHSHPGTPEPINAYEKVDLIKYYNKAFLPRIEDYLKSIGSDEAFNRIPPMLQPKSFGMISPMKRSLVEGVSVQPLSVGQLSGERRHKFSMSLTPRKDLQAINRVVQLASSPNRTTSEEKLFSFRR